MDPSAIREQIDKILRSPTLASKSQLRKLLEVVHQNMDSEVVLNHEQVIKELWPAETRTKRSADVATEMNRLRHALKSYYEGEGAGDSILISLPNRSVTAVEGGRERPWIVAEPRAGAKDAGTKDGVAGDSPPKSQVKSPRGLKIIVPIGAFCVVLGLAAYVSVRVLAVHGQPKFGRLDGSTLRITDAQGKELWSKNFPDGFASGWYYEKKEFGPRIWFADLEGRGHTSVVFSYLPAAGSRPHSSSLICYSDRGREKWRWTPGKDLPEVNGPVTYQTFSLGVLKATEKRPPRIVVVSNADPWWGGPSQVAVLDSNGKTLSEYWHSGGLFSVVLADLDGDGGEEIIVTGVAHGYDHQATLVVLDPERVFGASTEAMPEFQIHNMGVAQEKLRLLFPRSDLNRASFQFNFAIEPAVEHGNLRLKVLDCVAPIGCPIRYEFDKDLRLIAAYLETDEFRIAHDRLYQNGNDAHTLRAEERAAFLRVRCLMGCKSDFVPVAETYNPATSFERGWTTHNNPDGAWSYGYSGGFAQPITLYDKTVQNGINGQNAQYWLSSSVDAGTSPAAEYNDGPSYNDANVDLLANEFLLVAGIRGQYSDLIFTAPVGGEYSIAGNFRGAQYGVGTVVGIVANGKVVFSSSVTSVGQLVPFNMTLSLPARSTVIFSVGPGSGTQNTGLSATITRPCALTDKAISTSTGEITCSAGLKK